MNECDLSTGKIAQRGLNEVSSYVSSHTNLFQSCVIW